MFRCKVIEASEVFDCIRKAEKFDKNRNLLLVYFQSEKNELGLKVNEFIQIKDKEEIIYKVIRFLSIRKKTYIDGALHMVIEPYSICAKSYSHTNHISFLSSKSTLIKINDYVSLMNLAVGDVVTQDVIIKFLFMNIQKIIDEFDPYSLCCAPIDEYDDLSQRVLGILLDKQDHDKYSRVYNEIVKYSDMTLKSDTDVKQVMEKLLSIDIMRFGF